MPKTITIAVGDRVAYAARFLRSVGGDYDMAQGRAIVKELKDYGNGFVLATLQWERSAELPERVHAGNLAKVGSAAFADAGA